MRKTEIGGFYFQRILSISYHLSHDYLAPYFRPCFYGIYAAQGARFSGITLAFALGLVVWRGTLVPNRLFMRVPARSGRRSGL
jgi:hypothetical protein